MPNHHFVGDVLYWDSMEDFYADTEDFIERRGYDVSHMDNRERVSHAAVMARIDATTQPIAPETPDMLRLIRIYIKGMGGLRPTKSMLALLPPPDYYTDDHALNCGCELCVERAEAQGLTIISERVPYDGVVTGSWDEQMAQEATEDARFEGYLLNEERYDMPSWAERYDW